MISQLMPSQRSIGRQQKFLITQPRRVCVCVGVGVGGCSVGAQCACVGREGGGVRVWC